MKKTRGSSSEEFRPGHNLLEHLRNGVRGKHAKAPRCGSNLVPLDADIRRAFRDEKAVNDALRLVIQLPKIGRARV